MRSHSPPLQGRGRGGVWTRLSRLQSKNSFIGFHPAPVFSRLATICKIIEFDIFVYFDVENFRNLN